MNNARIAIIGCGPSGIAAATKLLELGFQKITLIEAENRIGGRIHTIPFAANVVDLGAQWCHGEKDNVVYDLAYKENLLEHSKENETDFTMIRSDKTLICYNLVKRLTAIHQGVMDAAETDLEKFDGNVGQYVDREFFNALKKPENSNINLTKAKEIFENFKKVEYSLNACDSLEELSSKNYNTYHECEGDQVLNWKGKGYVQLLRLLMKSTESDKLGVLEGKVKLGKPVKQIVWSPEASQPVRIKCHDDEVIEADHVVVTVSLGVLKEKHSKLFEPQLPVEKIQAIETIGFGTINKMYMEFPEQFWHSDWTGFSAIWRDEDLAELRGTNRAWLEDCIGFYPVRHQPNLLCGWMVSANARYMETLPEDEVIRGCLYLLRRFLHWDVPDPVTFKRTTWSSNENFRGSYSFQSVKAEKVNAKPSDLASPLMNSDKKPIILFAGEATSDHHYSTVHGAVETGWREAKRFAELYGNDNKESA